MKNWRVEVCRAERERELGALLVMQASSPFEAGWGGVGGVLTWGLPSAAELTLLDTYVAFAAAAISRFSRANPSSPRPAAATIRSFTPKGATARSSSGIDAGKI
jgi:hypothetical protein